ICAGPGGVGCGIRAAAPALGGGRIADAVVVGSRIVSEIETAPEGECATRVKQLGAELRRGVDAASK
ncbi:MAG: tryptophan synthase subunit alpha, partial [Thiobacillus sp.]|nr:tryptophan synthase subunit alpha [Thiobacillus sp.]